MLPLGFRRRTANVCSPSASPVKVCCVAVVGAEKAPPSSCVWYLQRPGGRGAMRPAQVKVTVPEQMVASLAGP